MTSSNLNYFFNNIFYWKGAKGSNMSSKIYNILRQYYFCIKFDKVLFSLFGMLMKIFNLNLLIFINISQWKG